MYQEPSKCIIVFKIKDNVEATALVTSATPFSSFLEISRYILPDMKNFAPSKKGQMFQLWWEP